MLILSGQSHATWIEPKVTEKQIRALNCLKPRIVRLLKFKIFQELKLWLGSIFCSPGSVIRTWDAWDVAGGVGNLLTLFKTQHPKISWGSYPTLSKIKRSRIEKKHMISYKNFKHNIWIRLYNKSNWHRFPTSRINNRFSQVVGWRP